MSDRRAVSAGHLGASSVAAAHEAWRVAVGGNRVESMTVEQIAHAFHGGHLNVRTPLWPPGATGWQALGNFPEFQTHPSAYAQPELAQFAEADDDPTRMWTGGNDLDSMEAEMQAAPGQRPSARTGRRQVMSPRSSAQSSPGQPEPPPVNYSQPDPYAQQGYGQQSNAYAMPTPPAPSRPAPMPSRPVPTASVASQQPALVPSSMPPFRQKSRGNGLMLMAGLVGLVGLGSAVLAARGNWGAAAEPKNEDVAVSAEASPAPAVSAAPAAAAEPAPAAAEAPKGEAQLAKYDDTSAFVGEAAKPAAKEAASEEAKPAATKLEATPAADEPKSASDADAAHDEPKAKSEKVSSKAAHPRSEEPVSKKVVVREKKRAAPPPPERSKPVVARVERAVEKAEAPEKAEKPEKPEKSEKAEKPEKAVTEAPQGPANSAVNEAAAAALTNSANLASSCRPRGGPAGAGKARVVYSNDGEVQSVEILTAKFRDTLTGSCVRMVFRRAKIPAFKGEPPTFIKSFNIPEE